jgi:hypothetical protein
MSEKKTPQCNAFAFMVSVPQRRIGPLVSLQDCVLAVVFPNFPQASGQTKIEELFEVTELRMLLPTICVPVDISHSVALESAYGDICENLLEWRRPRLLLAGARLEYEITATALRCNAEGFEVFLLVDNVAVDDQKNHYAFELRLTQAGVIPVTFKQVLTEWIAMEADAATVTRLLAVKASYEARMDAPR